MSETDGIAEAMEEGIRVGAMLGGRLAEVAMREREQRMREAQAVSEQHAAELADRYDAERTAARAQLAAASSPEWWDHAQPHEIRELTELSERWADSDPDAARAREHIHEQLEDRYGAQHPGRAAGADATDTAVIVAGADRADRDADAARGNDDSSRRRVALGEDLAAAGVGSEAIEARVLDDVSQARPAADAVTQAPRGADVQVARQRDVERRRAAHRSAPGR